LLAAFTLVALAVVGVISDQGDQDPARDNAAEEQPAAEPTPTPDDETADEEPVATPTPTEDPEEEETTLALEDGLQVQLVAKRARCWIEVTSDGELITPGGVMLELGDRSETFTADNNMEIVLGYAEGVDLVVNGRNVGPPGGPDAVVVSLPEDVQDLF
jgi:hypothetical protein